MAGALIAVGFLHLGLSAARLNVAHNRTLDITLVAIAGAYVLVALRISTRRVVLKPDNLLVVGMLRTRIRRDEIYGVAVNRRGAFRGSAAVVVGLDKTGLGRPLCTVRFAKGYQLHAFVQALNKWCGFDEANRRRRVLNRTVAAMQLATQNLDAQADATADAAPRGPGGLPGKVTPKGIPASQSAGPKWRTSWPEWLSPDNRASRDRR
jgi:hypothetical protein